MATVATARKVSKIVGVGGQKFPKTDIESINKNEMFVRNHKGHTITMQYRGAGIFRFSVDGSDWMTCYGHPTEHPQGDNKVPSAVAIYLKKGIRPSKFTWARLFRNNINHTYFG